MPFQLGNTHGKGAPKGHRYNVVHGHGGRKNKSSTYQSYKSMLTRCYSVNHISYKYYGAKGIRVCSRWLPENNGFANFLEDMGERPKGKTLDRKRVNGNYTPGNCRWSDRKTQDNNKSSTVRITYKGQTRSLKEWADVLGLKYMTLYYRIQKYGWPVARAFTTPLT